MHNFAYENSYSGESFVPSSRFPPCLSGPWPRKYLNIFLTWLCVRKKLAKRCSQVGLLKINNLSPVYAPKNEAGKKAISLHVTMQNNHTQIQTVSSSCIFILFERCFFNNIILSKYTKHITIQAEYPFSGLPQGAHNQNASESCCPFSKMGSVSLQNWKRWLHFLKENKSLDPVASARILLKRNGRKDLLA